MPTVSTHHRLIVQPWRLGYQSCPTAVYTALRYFLVPSDDSQAAEEEGE
jgi:hypothetical protein